VKQMSDEKYSIAWFRLAECVSRGQKERALGVYRLLSHSIDDPALAIQLKADLLWTFNDPQAVELYVEAAQAYQKAERLQQAAAVYEHVLDLSAGALAKEGLNSENPICVAELLFLYTKLQMAQKVVKELPRWLEKFAAAEDKKVLQRFLSALEAKSEALCAVAKKYLAR